MAAAGLAVRSGLDARSCAFALSPAISPGAALPTAPDGRDIALFALNGFLNVTWSALFFRLKRPDWALAEVGLLWLSIVVLIVVIARHSKNASVLLAPYLAWVTFAAVLNLAIVQLNGPFA